MTDRKILIHGENGYEVTITSGSAFEKLNKIAYKYPCAVVVTDSNVWSLYKDRYHEEVPVSTQIIVLDAGEKSKSYENLVKLWQGFSDAGLDRHGAVIALGGGVIGDIAGFAASTYYRGVDFYNFPTSLLAMVDSSIGGKTAIDLPTQKNAVGTFYRPKEVIVDVDFLNTLEKKDFTSGMGEIFKYALIDKNGLFEMLEKDDFDIPEVIEKCINIKKYYVEQDEFDKGIRMSLNLGHTYAHAFETLSSYTLSHGECVAYGCCAVVLGCSSFGYCSKELFERTIALYKKYFKCPDEYYEPEVLFNAVLKDKKKNGDIFRIVYPKDIGQINIMSMGKDDFYRFFLHCFYNYDF